MDFNFYTIERKGIFRKSYDIFQGEDLVFFVRSSGMGFLRNFKIYDHNGLELMQIKRPLTFFTMIFKLMEFDSVIAEIKREFTFLKTSLLISSTYGDYLAEGNFRNNDFTLSKNNEEVAKISRQKIISKRRYGVAIVATENPLFILGIAMTIEIMMRVRRRRK